MDQAFTPPAHSVNHFLTPTEQQQLQAAGISQALIAGLLRAFLTALLTSLPGMLGSTTPSGASAPTKPVK